MSIIDETFEYLVARPSDINEHLRTLERYAEQSESVIELGTRSIVSLWALLAGRPCKAIAVDLYHPSHYGGNLDAVINACQQERINFEFIQANDLEIELEDNFDLLFIDTDHTYVQLTAELNKFSPKINKFIIMHDTSLFGEKQIYDGRFYGGMKDAVAHFVLHNPEWKVKEVFENNNGLTVLERC
jgi:cephalosporin hydroxylase